MAVVSDPRAVGGMLGRYEVIKHLAQGGMAEVLLGRSSGIEGFERYVVIKRIRGDQARDQQFVRMFLDEARLAASLHHNNILQVHDIGEESGEYFFTGVPAPRSDSPEVAPSTTPGVKPTVEPVKPEAAELRVVKTLVDDPRAAESTSGRIDPKSVPKSAPRLPVKRVPPKPTKPPVKQPVKQPAWDPNELLPK